MKTIIISLIFLVVGLLMIRQFDAAALITVGGFLLVLGIAGVIFQIVAFFSTNNSTDIMGKPPTKTR